MAARAETWNWHRLYRRFSALGMSAGWNLRVRNRSWRDGAIGKTTTTANLTWVHESGTRGDELSSQIHAGYHDRVAELN
jgi:hypothetical protein